MKLHKALKVKNRLVGEIQRLKKLIERDNSKRDDKFDLSLVQSNFVDLEQTIDDLIVLKAKIQKATAPISEKLLEMAELKGQIGWYGMLSTKEGTFEIDNYRTEKTKTEVYHCFFTQNDVDSKVMSIQKRIEDLQDEIDEYNASTNI